jgi:hypothetical protein
MFKNEKILSQKAISRPPLNTGLIQKGQGVRLNSEVVLVSEGESFGARTEERNDLNFFPNPQSLLQFDEVPSPLRVYANDEESESLPSGNDSISTKKI